MKVKKFSMPVFSSNCYLIFDDEDRHAVAVDPSVPYLSVVEELHAPVVIDAIVLTHAHADHFLALDDWRKATGAPLLMGAMDAEAFTDPSKTFVRELGVADIDFGQADRVLSDKDEISLGAQTLTVMSTPGHSPGSICLLGGDFVISGDTLFAQGSVGRTDLPGGCAAHMADSLKALLALPSDTAVYPGHGYATTIGREAEIHRFFTGDTN